ARVRARHELVDARPGRGRGRPPGDHPAPGHRRDHPCRLGPARRALVARQALDHQSRSGIRAKKSQRDHLIRLAMPHPAWVLGCEDESWWSRVAPPACHAWADDQPLRLVAQTVAKDDPDPKALACYGIIVRTWTDTGQRQQESWLRCVGVRIVPCPLPIKGPRFHPIEPPGSMARAK